MRCRWIAVLLCLALCVGSLLTPPATVAAEEAFPVNDGVDFAALTDGNSFVYLGSYRHPVARKAEDGAFDTTKFMMGSLPPGCYEDQPSPVLWQVMGEEEDETGTGDGMLGLLSKYTLHSMDMAGSPAASNYAGSEIAAWLNHEFLDSFSEAEQEAMPVSEVKTGIWKAARQEDASYTYTELTGEYGAVTWPTTVRQKVYLPWAVYLDGTNTAPRSEYWSAGQVIGKNLVIAEDQPLALQTSALRGQDTKWYRNQTQTRSPYDTSLNHVLTSYTNGAIRQLYIANTADHTNPFRPVTKLCPDRIVMASLISETPVHAGQVQATGLLPAGEDGESRYQLTLTDQTLQLSMPEPSIEVTGGQAAKLYGLKPSAAGEGYAIGYKIVQAQGETRKIVASGLTAKNSLSAGENEISIPAVDQEGKSLEPGEYTLHVWLQREGQASNAASVPAALSMHVKEAPPLREYTTDAWQSPFYPEGTGQEDNKQFVSDVTPLPQMMEISKIVMQHDSSKVMSFQISLSEDGVNYVPVTPVCPGGTEAYSGRQIYRFAPTRAGFVRYRAVLLGKEETCAVVESMKLSSPEITKLELSGLPEEINPADTDEVRAQVSLTDTEGDVSPADLSVVGCRLVSAPEGVSLSGDRIALSREVQAGTVVIEAEEAISGCTARREMQVTPKIAIHNLSFYEDQECTRPVTSLKAGQTVYAGGTLIADLASVGEKLSLWAALYRDEGELEQVEWGEQVLTDARKGDLVTVPFTLPDRLSGRSYLMASVWDGRQRPVCQPVLLGESGTRAGCSVQEIYLGLNQSFPLRYNLPQGGATYESANPEVASVDQGGIIRSAGEGRTEVLVKSGETLIASLPVRVQAGMYVYLQMGQSNSTGTNYATYMPDVDLTVSPGVYLLNQEGRFEQAQHRYTRFTQVTNGAGDSAATTLITPRGGVSMSYQFAERFVASHRMTDFGLIGNTLSGCRLEVFEKESADPGANGFANSVVRAKAAVEGKDAVLKGIIWHQGESNGPSADYTWHMRNMVYDFRKALGDMELPFLAGGLATDRSWLPVEEQDAAAAGPRLFNQNLVGLEQDLANFGFVSSEGLKLRHTEEPISDNPDDGFSPDTSHFSARAQVEFGKRYYNTYLEIIRSERSQ